MVKSVKMRPGSMLIVVVALIWAAAMTYRAVQDESHAAHAAHDQVSWNGTLHWP